MVTAGSNNTEKLVKSRQRVSDHGEVFTPGWMVNDMLDLVKQESERIDSRFLEPACGSGNFLAPVLERKLAIVASRYRRSDYERRHYALFALMCIYGIELQEDNANECRARLLRIFAGLVGAEEAWTKAGERVLALNIVHGDALAMTDASGAPILLAEWGYLGRGRYQRRDFRYGSLAQRGALDIVTTHSKHAAFTPVKSWPQMSAAELAEIA